MHLRESRMYHDTDFQTADAFVRTLVGTGISALDRLLGGGYERGLVHLFYGEQSFHDDMLCTAVWAQLPESQGGLGSSVIIIDSSNMIDTLKLADYASSLDLDIEAVMGNILISRAFNSSQTYDLLINHLDEFLENIPAKLLLVPGLPDLFTSEGLDSQRTQQIVHISARLMARTLQHRLVTLVSTSSNRFSKGMPYVGQALASSAQVHILVEQTPTRILYTLTKHPSLPVATESRTRYSNHYSVTLPLHYFFDDLPA